MQTRHSRRTAAVSNVQVSGLGRPFLVRWMPSFSMPSAARASFPMNLALKLPIEAMLRSKEIFIVGVVLMGLAPATASVGKEREHVG